MLTSVGFWCEHAQSGVSEVINVDGMLLRGVQKAGLSAGLSDLPAESGAETCCGLMPLSGFHCALSQEKLPRNKHLIFLSFLLKKKPMQTKNPQYMSWREQLNECTKPATPLEEKNQGNKIAAKFSRASFCGHSAPQRYLLR